jgi:hypothetical protein
VQLQPPKGHSGGVRSVAFSPDGKILQSNLNWQEEIDLTWFLLNQLCNIRVDRSCGTHVHVSPEGRFLWEYPYTLDELKRIAKAVIYYDSAVTLILPGERKACSYSRSNVLENAQLKGVYDAVRTYGYGYLLAGSTLFPTTRLYPALFPALNTLHGISRMQSLMAVVQWSFDVLLK